MRRTNKQGRDTPEGAGPRLPRVYLPRHRLWERLDRATEGAVTLLVAPVGAGKTLGVAGWLRRTEAPYAAATAWVQADRSWTPSRVRELLEGADDAAGPGLVVVDDAHALPAASLRLVDEWLTTRPEALRALLVSRRDLPLTRLVPELMGHLTVLRGDLLRLDDAESAILITEQARTRDPDVVATVTGRARGWCAAVVLTSRAIGAAPDPAAAARHYRDGASSIVDLVANDVFSTLSSRQRHVLLAVAGAEKVSSGEAAHLSHDAGAEEVLAELELTGLLVTRVPGNAPGDDVHYRIHPLLAEVVRRRLLAGGTDVMRAQATVARAVRLDRERGISTGAFRRLLGVNAVDEAAAALGRDGVRMVLCEDGAEAEISRFSSSHATVVDAHPETWFPIALDRWIADDLDHARPWIERIIDRGTTPEGASRRTGEAQGDLAVADPWAYACARLWRARLGLEPVEEVLRSAVELAQGVPGRTTPAELRPVLLHEIGAAHNWLGDLEAAEFCLTTAVELSRSLGLTALAASAMSRLAFTELMAGRERACAEVATEAMGLTDAPGGARMRFSFSRAAIALGLAKLADLPAQSEPVQAPWPGVGSHVHSADLCTRFWLRIRDARLALAAGSVVEAEQILTTPADTTALNERHLPTHLQVAELLERAFLAALAFDQRVLGDIEERLRALAVPGEADLVAGLLADLQGDRAAAATLLATAAAGASRAQPPVRALALAGAAQLLDALGDTDAALDALAAAATETEVRRNAAPFLGWFRQGTPIQGLLTRLDHRSSTRWVHELTTAAAGHADATAVFAPTTPTPRERAAVENAPPGPDLSPREREVLIELSRGSTYADIAATLVVSENTVKTHVSSLYAKLSVARRSEALALARRLHLL